MMKVKRLFQGRRTLMSITVRSAQYRLLETPLPGASSTAPHHTFLFPFPLYPFLLFPLCFPDTQKHRFLSNLSPVHLMLAWIIPQFASPSVSLFTSSPPVGSTINPTSPNVWQCLVSMWVTWPCSFKTWSPGFLGYMSIFLLLTICGASSNPKHLQKKSCPCQHGLDYSAITDKQGEHCGMFHEVPPDMVRVSTPLACMPWLFLPAPQSPSNCAHP